MIIIMNANFTWRFSLIVVIVFNVCSEPAAATTKPAGVETLPAEWDRRMRASTLGSAALTFVVSAANF